MAEVGRIEVSHSYDKESDVLYVSFGDDEPTYAESIDDVVMLEVGWFSGLPKGLTVVGLKSNNIGSLQGMIVQVSQKACRLMEQRRALIQEQEPAVVDALKNLPHIFRQDCKCL